MLNHELNRQSAQPALRVTHNRSYLLEFEINLASFDPETFKGRYHATVTESLSLNYQMALLMAQAGLGSGIGSPPAPTKAGQVLASVDDGQGGLKAAWVTLDGARAPATSGGGGTPTFDRLTGFSRDVHQSIVDSGVTHIQVDANESPVSIDALFVSDAFYSDYYEVLNTGQFANYPIIVARDKTYLGALRTNIYELSSGYGLPQQEHYEVVEPYLVEIAAFTVTAPDTMSLFEYLRHTYNLGDAITSFTLTSDVRPIGEWRGPAA